MPEPRQQYLPAPRSLRELFNYKQACAAAFDLALVNLAAQLSPLPSVTDAIATDMLAQGITPEIAVLMHAGGVPVPVIEALDSGFNLVKARDAVDQAVVDSIEALGRSIARIDRTIR